MVTSNPVANKDNTMTPKPNPNATSKGDAQLLKMLMPGNHVGIPGSKKGK